LVAGDLTIWSSASFMPRERRHMRWAFRAAIFDTWLEPQPELVGLHDCSGGAGIDAEGYGLIVNIPECTIPSLW
jgi:hypothetical protein